MSQTANQKTARRWGGIAEQETKTTVFPILAAAGAEAEKAALGTSVCLTASQKTAVKWDGNAEQETKTAAATLTAETAGQTKNATITNASQPVKKNPVRR